MRVLNEKTLSRLCYKRRCSREGYLLLRRGSSSSDKRYYFRLCGNLLYYLERLNDELPIGVIILEGQVVESGDEQESATFLISFPGGGTVYQLTTASAEDANQWMHAIISASHECVAYQAELFDEQLRALTIGVAGAAAAASSEQAQVDDTLLPLAGASRCNPFNTQTQEAALVATAAVDLKQFSAVLSERIDSLMSVMIAQDNKD